MQYLIHILTFLAGLTTGVVVKIIFDMKISRRDTVEQSGNRLTNSNLAGRDVTTPTTKPKR